MSQLRETRWDTRRTQPHLMGAFGGVGVPATRAEVVGRETMEFGLRRIIEAWYVQPLLCHLLAVCFFCASVSLSVKRGL